MAVIDCVTQVFFLIINYCVFPPTEISYLNTKCNKTNAYYEVGGIVQFYQNVFL